MITTFNTTFLLHDIKRAQNCSGMPKKPFKCSYQNENDKPFKYNYQNENDPSFLT